MTAHGHYQQGREGAESMASNNRTWVHPISRPGRRSRVTLLPGFLALLVLMAGPTRVAGQGMSSSIQQTPPPTVQSNQFPQIVPPDFPKSSEKQKQALVDYNFKKLKKHAADLAELAKSLQKEIEKSNENILSLDIVKKADKVEKLARKVKSEVKGGQ